MIARDRHPSRLLAPVPTERSVIASAFGGITLVVRESVVWMIEKRQHRSAAATCLSLTLSALVSASGLVVAQERPVTPPAEMTQQGTAHEASPTEGHGPSPARSVPEVVEPATPSGVPEKAAPTEAGQGSEPTPGSSPEAAALAAEPLPDPSGKMPVSFQVTEYQVGPGDVLEVTVIGNDELSRVATVQPSGIINLPLLQAVRVATLSTAEIARKLTALLSRDFLVDPQVEVRVKEYQSQFVTVVGEVNQPGRRPLRGRTRLFDVLLESGGFTPRASGEVTVTRRDGAFDGGEQMLRLRFGSANPSPADLLNLEIPLANGDLVAALPKRYITVEGEVQRPARYPLELDFSLSQAVLGAGGLTRYGKSDIRIRRTDPISGAVSFVEADLKAIRDGKVKDLLLLPDDVVIVPRRTF